MFWIKDPKTKKKSVTLTFFTIAFLIACGKLALSGIKGFETFTGADFAAVIGAAGALYSFRKHTDKDKNDDKNEDSL